MTDKHSVDGLAPGGPALELEADQANQAILEADTHRREQTTSEIDVEAVLMMMRQRATTRRALRTPIGNYATGGAMRSAGTSI